jgi:hypothetical protein
LHGAEYREPPAYASEDTAELGELAATLHKPGENRRHRKTLGWGIILAGSMLVALGWFLRNPRDAEDLVGYLLGASALMIIGVSYNFLRRRNPDVTYWFFENGVLMERAERLHVRRWDEVEAFQVNLKKGRANYWMITVWQDVCVFIKADDAPAAPAIMRWVEAKLTSARFLPTLRRIHHGVRVPFGAMELDRTGCWGPGFSLLWLDIDAVVAGETSMIIEQRDQEAAEQIRYRDVSFPSLMIAIANVLIEEDKLAEPGRA